MSRKDLLEVARHHYNPDLVEVDRASIEAMPWGRHIPMQINVPWMRNDRPQVVLQMLITMGALNYRFWTVDEGAIKRYVKGEDSGARALWSSFAQHWTSDAEDFRKKFERLGVQGLLGPIPDAKSRGIILTNLLQGQLLEFTASTLCDDILGYGAVQVAHAHELARCFPTAFADPLLKKAQLLLEMFARYLHPQGHTIDVRDLTGFADYQVPRVLHALELTTYSTDLASAIDALTPLDEDGGLELAIRSATVLACDAISKNTGLSASEVDNLMWQSQDVAKGRRFHLTNTTRY